MERYDLPAEKLASPEELGMLRVADETDEKNCSCNDAAITPSNLHNVLGSRKANTAYTGNEFVACPYQPGLLLKCVQAGTTSTSLLDTTSVTEGQILTDGGVKWLVESMTYSNATTSSAGLMSADDKTKLDGITANAAYQLPYATCSTAANTTAKVATITNGAPFSLEAGAMVVVKFTKSNSTPNLSINTLNVNSTGAKTVKMYRTSNAGTDIMPHENNTHLFVYDGTYWNSLSDLGYSTASTGN